MPTDSTNKRDSRVSFGGDQACMLQIRDSRFYIRIERRVRLMSHTLFIHVTHGFALTVESLYDSGLSAKEQYSLNKFICHKRKLNVFFQFKISLQKCCEFRYSF